jgi:hypothetical protein
MATRLARCLLPLPRTGVLASLAGRGQAVGYDTIEDRRFPEAYKCRRWRSSMRYNRVKVKVSIATGASAATWPRASCKEVQ